MSQEEKLDLMSRVESLYWSLFVPFTEALDKYYGKLEKKQDNNFDIVKNLLTKKDEEILETPIFNGYLGEQERRAITGILVSYAEDGKKKIQQIYQNAGVDLHSDQWLANELWLASLSLAEEIKKNTGGNLDSLRKIRWGLKLGLEMIPGKEYQEIIYKVIEELEEEGGQRIKKTIDFFNQRE